MTEKFKIIWKRFFVQKMKMVIKAWVSALSPRGAAGLLYSLIIKTTLLHVLATTLENVCR